MVKQGFDRSIYMKEKHSLAKLEYETYKKDYPTKAKDLKYKDFMKKETPVSELYVAYEVSFQVDYFGSRGAFSITSNTFEVYSIDGNRDKIERQLLNSVVDSKGEKTGFNLKTGTLNQIENNFTSKINPRGIEEKDISNLSFAERELILKNRNVIRNIDSNVQMVNEKTKSKGRLRLDINHFLD